MCVTAPSQTHGNFSQDMLLVQVCVKQQQFWTQIILQTQVNKIDFVYSL